MPSSSFLLLSGLVTSLALTGCTHAVEAVGGGPGGTGGGSAAVGGKTPCNPDVEDCEPLPPGPQPGAPWPMMGDDESRHGQSQYAGAQSNTIRWSVKGLKWDEYVRGLTIDAAGFVYVPASDELVAIDFQGNQKWSQPIWADQPPIVAANDVLYMVNAASKEMLALDPADGHTKWLVDHGGDETGSGMAVSRGGAVLGVYKGWLVAVNTSGLPLWETFINSPLLFSTPAIAYDGTAYVVGDALTAVTSKGDILWNQTLDEVSVGSPTDPMIAQDGTVYAARPEHLYAVANDGTVTKTAVSAGAETANRWLAEGLDGTIYLAVGDRESTDPAPPTLYAIEPHGGAVKWSIQGQSGSYVSAPAVGGDGIVYVTLGTEVYALRPDGSELWSYTADDECTGLAIGITSTTYARCGDTLYVFGD